MSYPRGFAPRTPRHALSRARSRHRPAGSGLLHGRSDEVAPFGPGAVVVPHILESQEVLENEPGMARTLADPAVGNHRFVGGHALRLVQGLQLVMALERAVVVARFGPGDALGTWNVAAALARF